MRRNDTNVLIYDLEILRGVPARNEESLPGVEYCAGWHDHANMGITVLGVYDYAADQYRVFCGDNRAPWIALMSKVDTLLVGFNNIAFDNAVLRATEGWGEPDDSKCYDLLREIWAAAGYGSTFTPATHAGYGLDAMCKTNFGQKKTGNGAHAPIAWQHGDFGEVIDYCLNDVRLTKKLFDKVRADGALISPKDGSVLSLRRP